MKTLNGLFFFALFATLTNSAFAGETSRVNVARLAGTVQNSPALKIKSVQLILGLKNITQYMTGRTLEKGVRTKNVKSELSVSFSSEGGTYSKWSLLKGGWMGCYVAIEVKVQDQNGKVHTAKKYLVDKGIHSEQECLNTEDMTLEAQNDLQRELVPVLRETPAGTILYIE